jgi:hypothetical protein
MTKNLMGLIRPKEGRGSERTELGAEESAPVLRDYVRAVPPERLSKRQQAKLASLATVNRRLTALIS